MIRLPTPPAKTSYFKIFTQYSSSLLVFLFVYTALSKWFSFEEFRGQMHNQEIPSWLAEVLIWLLPPVEIIAAGLLLFERARYAGFWLSFILMILFTGYVTLIVVGFFDRVPCSCGGVLRSLKWNAHLVLNLFFLLLSFLNMFFLNRERRMIGTD